MAVDATGTPTSLGIPTFNVNVDAPSGLGSNAQMASIDALFKTLGIASLATNDVPLYDSGTGTWKKAGGAASSSTFLRGDGTWAAPTTAGVLPGVMDMWGGTAAPTGYVLCDGTSYLRADGVHDALFAAIGVNYGAADGTHFNVPDLQGRMPVGKGTNASVNTLNINDGQAAANRRPHHRTTNSLGASTFSGTTGNDSPDHAHSTNVWTAGSGAGSANLAMGNDQAAPVSDGAAASSGASARHTHSFSGSTSAPAGSIGTNNGADAIDVPSFIVVNFIIKL